jgi:dTDP-4-dehydrorhamnose reductase
MNILVYGSKGWIGGMFINILKQNNILYTVGVSRVDSIEDVTNEIDNIKPTHIISFIGRTHGPGFSTIDYLEQKDKLVENVRDNLFSPFVLAQICDKKNIHYTYLGTGCIFKYDDNHPNGFTENDKPNFFGSSYSVVKGFTDMMMHMYPNVLNLRIRMPITNENNPRNFITKITNYKKICSIPNSMTVLTELLPYVLDMMKNNITGTINLTNPLSYEGGNLKFDFGNHFEGDRFYECDESRQQGSIIVFPSY